MSYELIGGRTVKPIHGRCSTHMGFSKNSKKGEKPNNYERASSIIAASMCVCGIHLGAQNTKLLTTNVYLCFGAGALKGVENSMSKFLVNYLCNNGPN